MPTGLFMNQFSRCSRGNTTGDKFAVKIERGPLSPKLDVEVWRVMISEVRPDDNPEESRNDRHGSLFSKTGITSWCRVTAESILPCLHRLLIAATMLRDPDEKLQHQALGLGYNAPLDSQGGLYLDRQRGGKT